MSDKTVEKSVGKLPFIIVAMLVVGFIGYTLLPNADDISSKTETIEEAIIELPQPDAIDSSVQKIQEEVKVTAITDRVIKTVEKMEVIEEVEEKPKTPAFDRSTIIEDGTALPTIGIGDPNAPITLVEYSSLSCGHCAIFHKNTLPQLKEKYIDTGKVYMIFREFPLNKAAIDASKVLRCLPEDKYYSFMTLLFDTQAEWAFSKDYLKKLKQTAKLAGLNDEQIDTCLANEELEKKLAAGLKIGSETYNVRSTPSFVVNGEERLISGNQPITFFEKIFETILEEDTK